MFQCETCLLPFTLWRTYQTHVLHCVNDVKYTSSYKYKFIKITENELYKHDQDELLQNTNEIKWMKFDNDVPRFDELMKNQWMHRAVAVLNVHLEDSLKTNNHKLDEKDVIQKEKLKEEDELLIQENKKNKKVQKKKIKKKKNSSVEEDKNAAMLEFRTLAWSLGKAETDGFNSEELKIVTSILWGKRKWTSERHSTLFLILFNGATSFNKIKLKTMNENEEELSKVIPFNRVLEFWLGERVYCNSLVPYSLYSSNQYNTEDSNYSNNSNNSSTTCCSHFILFDSSTIKSRLKKTIHVHSMNGYMNSIESAARHCYYTELGTIMLQQQEKQMEQMKQMKQMVQDKNPMKEMKVREVREVGEEKEEKKNSLSTLSNKRTKQNQAHIKLTEQSIYAMQVQSLLLTRAEATLKYPQWIVLHSLGKNIFRQFFSFCFSFAIFKLKFFNLVFFVFLLKWVFFSTFFFQLFFFITKVIL